MGFSETPNSPWDSWEEAAGPFAALSRSVMSPDICEHITVISQEGSGDETVLLEVS